MTITLNSTPLLDSPYALSSEQIEAFREQGFIKLKEVFTAEELDAFREVVELDPAYPDVYSMLGVALFESNRFDEAAGMVEKALAINAEDPYANRTLGVIFARQERYAEALPLLEKALAIAPEHFQAQDILEYVRGKVGGGG